MRIFGKSEKTITISTETIVKAIVLTVGLVLILQFISQVTHQLTLIAVSAFLAIALNPAVTWITHRLKSKSRVRATGFAYVVVLALLAGFLWLVVPPLVSQTSEFIRDIPQTIEDFQRQDTAVSRFVRRNNIDEQLSDWTKDFTESTDSVAEPLLNTASRALGTLVSIVTVLVLTFMMLVEGPLWIKRILALQPADKRDHRKSMLSRMYRVVTGYVNGQVLVAAISGGFAFIALMIASSIFDASINAVALAGITFVFALIPLIGTTIGSSIVVLMCLFASTPLAITMAIYFLVYQQIENATLQPYIQSRSNQLTPLLVFVAALLGAGLGGLLGALAAIPVAGCLKIIIEDQLNKRLPNQASLEKS